MSLKIDFSADPIEGFKVISDEWAKAPFLNADFRFFEITFSTAGTFTIAHNMGFQPKDLIVSGRTGGASVSWDPDNFTRTDLVLTVSAPTTLRFFLGLYRSTK